MDDLLLRKIRHRRALRAVKDLIDIAEKHPDVIQPLSVQNLEPVKAKLERLESND